MCSFFISMFLTRVLGVGLIPMFCFHMYSLYAGFRSFQGVLDFIADVAMDPPPGYCRVRWFLLVPVPSPASPVEGAGGAGGAVGAGAGAGGGPGGGAAGGPVGAAGGAARQAGQAGQAARQGERDLFRELREWNDEEKSPREILQKGWEILVGLWTGELRA